MKFIICVVTIISLLTATTVESFACDDHSSSSSTHDTGTKETKEKSKADYSHSCCHAHHALVKLDKPDSVMPLSFEGSFYPAAHKIYSDYHFGPLLEPPTQA